MKYKVRSLSPERRDDFYHLHSHVHGGGWCFCVAWWVETWEHWTGPAALYEGGDSGDSRSAVSGASWV